MKCIRVYYSARKKIQKNYKTDLGDGFIQSLKIVHVVSYRIINVYTKKFKNALKKCNAVQYVCLFNTLQVLNKDVCIINKVFQLLILDYKVSTLDE